MIGAWIDDEHHICAMQEVLQCCGVLVKSMGRAEVDAALHGALMPALVKAFQHSSADVRKAVRAPVLTVMISLCTCTADLAIWALLVNRPHSALPAFLLISDHRPTANSVSYMFLRQTYMS